MNALTRKINEYRFEDHRLVYAALYLLMIAPPRAFDIKSRQHAMQGELALLPTYWVAAVEIMVRFACVLVTAAMLEAAVGNNLYESHRIDIFFGTLIALGAIHSATFYVIYNDAKAKVTSLSQRLTYRIVRNSCYAALTGFITMLPILVWNWDHELPPFNNGYATQCYMWTVVTFLLIGLAEAKFMVRIPLGTNSPNLANIDGLENEHLCNANVNSKGVF